MNNDTEKLIAELRELAEEHELSANNNVQSIVAGINDIIDRHTPKPKDEGGLREAVKSVYEDIMLNEDTEYDDAESVAIAIGNALVNHPAPTDRQEALSVLMDRKGLWCMAIRNYQISGWTISIGNKKEQEIYGEVQFCGPTYEAAEAKAREWLEKQEDKK